MTQQQLITEAETKITETLSLIENYEQYLVKCKKTLAGLIKELTQIKQKINQKKINRQPWK